VWEEEFVAVRITVTSSPETERVGTIFLSTEIGFWFGLGRAVGRNSTVAIGRTKMVSQGVLRTRLRKMNAYAIPRYARAFRVSVFSLPSAREHFALSAR